MTRFNKKINKNRKNISILGVILLTITVLICLFIKNFNIYRNYSLRYFIVTPEKWVVSYRGRPIEANPELEANIDINPDSFISYDESKIEIVDFYNRNLEPSKSTLVEETTINGVHFQKFIDFDRPNSRYVIWLLGKNKMNRGVLILYRYENEQEKKIIEKIIKTLYFY